jgi:hypothetical protein
VFTSSPATAEQDANDPVDAAEPDSQIAQPSVDSHVASL